MKKIVFVFICIFFSVTPVYALDFYSAFHQPGALNITVEDIEKPYIVQLSYEGVDFYTVFSDCYEDSFVIDKLANGVTYYIRIYDSNGYQNIKRYTTPFTVVDTQQLKIVDIKDTSVNVDWSYLNAYYDMNVYLDGVLVRTMSSNVTSCTLDGLTPNREYRVHVTTKTGYSSNIVTFKTTNFEHNFFTRLDGMISKFFVPDNSYDGNFNGIPDTYDDIFDAWKKWENYSPIGIGKDTAGMIGDLAGDFNGSDEYPNFTVTFGPGLTFNAFNFDEFDAQIKIIRKLLEAVIWITFFMFLVQVLIPIFKL